MMLTNFNDYTKNLQNHLELKLQSLLPISDNQLHHAMAYSVLNGGKRFRPVLIYTTAETLGLSLKTVDYIACAVELIHCYSLIHDDLPDMDNDDLRRGKPTCHKAFDNATAILAGDALQTFAFELLVHPINELNAEQQLKTITLLTQAIGANGMAYGQMLDMMGHQRINEKELELIHINKTGKLIKACVDMVLVAANCNDTHKLEQFAIYSNCLGLCFQIKDDILDVEGTIDTLGKLPGVDNNLNKATYPAILGLETAKQRLQEFHQQGLIALQMLELDNSYLAKLLDFVVQRDK